MVLYFSGTGNSKYIAELVALAMNDSVVSINDGIKHTSYPMIDEREVLIFVVPTYAWRIPRVVRKWIDAGTVFSGHKAYFLLTCGDGIGNAEKYIKRLCTEKNLTFMGCAEIVMPENYIARYDCPSEVESMKIVEAAQKAVDHILPKIKANAMLPTCTVSMIDRIKSGIVNDVFYPLCVSSKKFYTTDVCIGCGICDKSCPTNNIHLKDKRPEWGTDCTHCMACICHCPTEAIEYGNISHGKRRYRCPK